MTLGNWAGRTATPHGLAAGCLALLVFGVGVWWGTWAVGGSDSHCYAGVTKLLAEGRLFAPQATRLTPPWPDAELTLAPTGFVPSPTIRGAISPICPPGLSIVMAPFWLFGGQTGLFLVVPLFGALAIWSTFSIGRRLDGPWVGVIASLLLATSPIFLYQLVQPMSDVPATACWALSVSLLASSLTRASATPRWSPRLLVAAGVAASIGVATRPNLAPMAAACGLFAFLEGASLPTATSERAPRSNGRRAGLLCGLWFVLGVLPGAIAIALLHDGLYGSPVSTGYGSPQALFSLTHIAPNVRQYAQWLMETHTPFLALALAAPLTLARKDGQQKRLLWLALALTLIVFACYVPYVVFDAWWYTRFLLPALPFMLILTAATIVALAGAVTRSGFSRVQLTDTRAPRWMAVVLITALVGSIAAWQLNEASARAVFQLWRLERRFVEVGDYVARTLPSDAVVITVWESGSIRFYSDRLTILWDSLDPGWLDRALDHLRESGRPPYFVFERFEEERFRARFAAHSGFGELDWPPMAQIGTDVRVYDPRDRERYQAGESIRTERVWPERR